MSMSRCVHCGYLVDTDEDDECYESFNEEGVLVSHACLCLNCREETL